MLFGKAKFTPAGLVTEVAKRNPGLARLGELSILTRVMSDKPSKVGFLNKDPFYGFLGKYMSRGKGGNMFSRGVYMIGATAVSGVIGFAPTAMKSIWNNIRRTRPGEATYGAGAGPGYISWSKKQGMPANNLSTRGLGQSLHANRHSSII